MPLWKFGAAIPFPQSNIARIERGLNEPRIGLAMRMLEVLNLKAGIFMHNLASYMNLPATEEAEISRQNFPFSGLDTEKEIAFEPQALFGILLNNARFVCHKTQMGVAEAAGYSSRSLISVEKGRQEPGLTSALKLAAATGIGVEWFFAEYGKLHTIYNNLT